MAIKTYAQFVESSFSGAGFIAGVGVDASFADADAQGDESEDLDGDGDPDTHDDLLYVPHRFHQTISGIDVIRMRSDDVRHVDSNQDMEKARRLGATKVILCLTDVHQYYIMDLSDTTRLVRFEPTPEDLNDTKS